MTSFTTEIWDKTILMNLKETKYGFGARIVNHNFHNPGGTKADAVKAFKYNLASVATDTNKNDDMPSNVPDASSTTVTLNLDQPIKYAIGLPWSLQLKTEYDIQAGFRVTAEDICVQKRGAFINAALDAESSIPTVTGTNATPVLVDKTTILDELDNLNLQLMSVGAIMEHGKFRFVEDETQENIANTAMDATPMDGMPGEQVPGILKGVVKEELPVLGCDKAIYKLIKQAATEAGELTQNKEFYADVPVIRGFQIVLDNSFDHTTDSTNKHHVVYVGTRNLVTEAMTDSRSEVIPDQNKYRDILRGQIIYGCKVTQPLCGAKSFFKVAGDPT